MQCSHCGTDIPADSLFCPECGAVCCTAPASPAAPPAAASRAKTEKSPTTSFGIKEQDKLFWKTLHDTHGPMEQVLMATSTVDYTKDADVRVAYRNLMEEARKQYGLLEPIRVSPAIAKSKEYALKCLESYALAGEYHLQYLDESAAHGQSKRATELSGLSNDYFQKGIEYDSMESIKAPSGKEYQDTDFSDAVLAFVDSPLYKTLIAFGKAKLEDRAALDAAVRTLLADLPTLRANLSSFAVAAHMAQMQTALGKALENYQASAEQADRCLQEQAKGNAGQATVFYDLSRRYLEIGKEYETAAFGMWENG